MMVVMAPNPLNSRRRTGPVLLAALMAAVAVNCAAAPIVFEAEHGTDIKLNFEIREVKDASGGLALTLDEGAGGTFGYGSNTNPDIFIGEATYNFTIEQPGQYFVSARVFWMDKCGNLLRIRVDGGGLAGLGSPDKDRHTFRKWYWQKSGPFHLKQGEHTLKAIAHEDGPMIDRWCIHRVEETPGNELKDNWPGMYRKDPLTPASVSISKPSEVIGDDGALPLTLWLRRAARDVTRCTIVVKGPKDMNVRSRARIPVRFETDEVLKRVDVPLRFPVNTPRGEKKITVFAMDESGKVGSVAMCMLARPYDWWILGPLPAPVRVEDGMGRGKDVTLTSPVTYETPEQKTEASWKALPENAFNRYQMIDLEKIYGQSTSATAYLYTEVRVEEDGGYLMLVNNDGALDIWIDGQDTYKDPRHHPACGWLRHHPLRLTKGRHTVLVRIEQNSPEDTDYQQNYWLFRIRLRKSRREPAPIGGLECERSPGSSPWGSRSSSPHSGRSR